MTGPTRILHLVENLERGGLERVVIDLAVEQRRQGCDVRALCLFEPGLLADELRRDGVPVDACHKRPGLDLSVLGAIRRAMAGHGTQVLHTHNAVAHYHGTMAGLAAPSLAVVNTRHGMGNAPFRRRREMLFRLAMARTAASALVCRRARDNFVKHHIVPAAKARVVPNGIRVEAFAVGGAARARAIEALGAAPTPFRIGTVGRLNPVKDHACLLEAMRRVLDHIPDARLVIVGGGALMEPLQAHARELGISGAVSFCGDRSDVASLLPAFDAFALSSITEGYSIALLEAGAAGLPCVATDVGGNAEIVADGERGRIVPARDPGRLADALVGLAREPALRARMGQAARQWVSNEGSVRVMADRYMSIYRDALA